MNKSGFLLIEALFGLAILGLISITFLPIVTSAHNNFYLLERKNEMKYYGESVMERLKAFDYSDENQEYVLDMSMVDIVDLFYNQDSVSLQLPLSEDYEDKYYVKLEKENIDDNLWNVKVIIEPRVNSERLKSVYYESNLPKPLKK